ncbi:MAG: TraR/DksA C4-type zinc finger protein [Proteobacteria bacterium]|nr:TraR/DksA C4-type zinc finger protein [Pseudomonadota bacterium]
MAKPAQKKPAPKVKASAGKKATPAKKTPAKKPAPAKKAAPAKKTAPVKKVTPQKVQGKLKPQAPVKKIVAKPAPTVKSQPKAPIAAPKQAIPVAKPKSESTTSHSAASVKTKVVPVSNTKMANEVPTSRGAVSSQPTAKVVKPIVVPEHFKKLQQQLDGIVEKSVAGGEVHDDKIPASELFTDAELALFLAALQDERSKLLEKAKAAVDGGNIALDKDEMYDEVDLASATVDQNLTFRLLDRDRKLLSEIDHAIDKIHNGEFGLCEGTGEPIPKRRLELRPWCKYSVKYKEQLEKLKKSGRGVVDEDEDVFA